MNIIIILILLISSSAYSADFDKTFTMIILPNEGGYTCARNDPGNWTGGKIGKGKLLGTKYGIAANTYGDELLKQRKTIKGLTINDAKALYKRDYWGNLELLKSQAIAMEICDLMVNMGQGEGPKMLRYVFSTIEWTQHTKADLTYRVPVKPDLSIATINWINEYTKSRANRMLFFDQVRRWRAAFYVNLALHKPSMRPFLLSWMVRTVD